MVRIAPDVPQRMAGQTAAPTSLLSILKQFTASDIPALGPSEASPVPRNWPHPDGVPDYPGRDLLQHPMLYAGEGYNTIFLVDGGKVVWTYSTGRGGEIDDAHDRLIREVSPQGENVWEFGQADLPPRIVMHNIQTADRLASGNTVIFSSTDPQPPPSSWTSPASPSAPASCNTDAEYCCVFSVSPCLCGDCVKLSSHPCG